MWNDPEERHIQRPPSGVHRSVCGCSPGKLRLLVLIRGQSCQESTCMNCLSIDSAHTTNPRVFFCTVKSTVYLNNKKCLLSVLLQIIVICCTEINCEINKAKVCFGSWTVIEMWLIAAIVGNLYVGVNMFVFVVFLCFFCNSQFVLWSWGSKRWRVFHSESNMSDKRSHIQ